MSANTAPYSEDILQAVLSGLGSASGSSMSSSPLVLTILCLSICLLPFALLSMTSFIKLSVVFAILRNALGAGQIPSAAVSTLLSFVLTLHIMNPVFREAGMRAEASLSKHHQEAKVKKTARNSELAALLEAISEAALPLREFMTKHSRAEERAFFSRLRASAEISPAEISPAKTASREIKEKNSQQNNSALNADILQPAQSSQEEMLGYSSLIPAFVLSQLREAFIIGFILFIPFLIIDLVCANLLVGLGMMMVSPVAISLPFKIVLFVAADGWFNLCRGLVLGYS